MARISNFEQQYDDWQVLKNRETVIKAFELMRTTDNQREKEAAMRIIEMLTEGT
jgi:hypothetical protein